MKRRFIHQLSTLAFSGILLAGCTRAPSFDIDGSLFPAWIICLVTGICLAISARWAFTRWQIPIILPVIVYPCLALVFTFLLWLIFFH